MQNDRFLAKPTEFHGRIMLIKPVGFVLMLFLLGLLSALFAIGGLAVAVDIALCLWDDEGSCRSV